MNMIVQYCSDCNEQLNTKMLATRCKPCQCRLIANARKKPKPTCKDCGNVVSRRDVKRCSSCNAKRMKDVPPNPAGTMRGEKSPSWRGGISKDKRGYVYIKTPNHPNANARGYIFEHRLIMEKHLGRYLTSKEVIHHLNHVKDDNRIDNLMLFASHSEHIGFHNDLKK